MMTTSQNWEGVERKCECQMACAAHLSLHTSMREHAHNGHVFMIDFCIPTATLVLLRANVFMRREASARRIPQLEQQPLLRIRYLGLRS